MNGASKAAAMTVLAKIAIIEEQYLNDDDLSFECHCCIGKGWRASTKRIGDDRLRKALGSVDDEINICPAFFDQDCTGMVRTMFHEITHIVVEVDTGDLAYEGEDAAAGTDNPGTPYDWPSLPPNQRINNADSWDKFLAPFLSTCTCDCAIPQGDIKGCIDYRSGTHIKCPPRDEWQR